MTLNQNMLPNANQCCNSSFADKQKTSPQKTSESSHSSRAPSVSSSTSSIGAIDATVVSDAICNPGKLAYKFDLCASAGIYNYLVSDHKDACNSHCISVLSQGQDELTVYPYKGRVGFTILAKFYIA